MAGSNLGFSIDISADIDRFIDRVGGASQHVPFVTAYALTKTAGDIKDESVAEMTRVFDRPTRFTLNALYVRSATKTDLKAGVYFKDGFGSIPAWRYLGPQVEGGSRAHKSHELRLIRAGIMRNDEYAVPGPGANLDGYGNLTGGQIELILSQVKAAEQFAGYKANATKRSQGRAKKRGRYFALRPNWPAIPDDPRAVRNVPPGIYWRAAGQRRIVPVMLFVRTPVYRARFKFYDIAKRIVKENFNRHFSDGWNRFVVQRGFS